MQRRHALHHIGLALSALGLATSTHAQTAAAFPSGPLRIFNPFPAGSGPDVVSRLVGERLGKAWSQPVVVDNRPGASGFIALQAAKAGASTGHDLVVAAADHMAINPALFKKLPYNVARDFVPVSGLYRVSFFVLVGEKSPINSITQLVAAARAKPGAVSYGSNAVGSPLHLGGAQLETATGTTMQHVPFKETVQLYQAVANGEVSWALGSIGSAGPLIAANKLRVLAVADVQRSPAMPQVPTLAEAGGPADVVVTSWVALFAPAAAPAAALASIDAGVQAALNLPELRSKFSALGFAPAPASGADVARWIATDTPRYADLVKRTGASVD